MSKLRNIAWRRLLLEGTTIVFSILLAFAIDAWWAEKNNNKEERRLLLSLQQEIDENLSRLEQGVVFRKAVGASAYSILAAAEGAIPALSKEEVDRQIGSLCWWRITDLSIGVLESISKSGKLSLVSDENLRARIASIQSVYTTLNQLERQHYDTFKDYLMPYLYMHGHIGQLSNAQRRSPGTGEGEQPEIPVLTRKDHSVLLSDREFVGIVTNIYWDQNDVLAGLQSTNSLLETLSSEIKSYLE